MSFTEPYKTLVPPSGSIDSKIAIIGEAPGKDEVTRGEPFVGKSGNLLNGMLAARGISRSDVYLDNVVPERPPDNKIGVFIKFKDNGSVEATESYHKYEHEFLMRMKSLKANVIVPMGNVPLYALTRLTPPKITSRRNSIYEVEIEGVKKKVIPTIHPAAALRTYMFRLYIMEDLRRIKEESEFPEVKLPERTLQLYPSYQEAIKYLKLTQLRFDNLVASDIEIINEQVSCISFSDSSIHAICINFLQGMENRFTPDEELNIWLNVNSIYENPDIPKLGQNFSFDAGFLLRRYGIATNNVHDTMLGQGMCHPDMPKDLGFIVSTRTKEPYYKDDGGKRHSGIGKSEKTFFSYNAKDSVVLIDAFPSIMSDLKKLGNEEQYEMQRKLIEPLTFMSERGTLMDEGGLKRASEKAGKEIYELKEELFKLCGYEWNPASPDQVAEYFYDKLGYPPYKSSTTKSGYTTDETALKRIANKESKGSREADIILDFRNRAKMKSTYYDAKLVDGRLKCFYDCAGASDTGRLSSKKTIFGEGANKQNQPSNMKKYMLVDPGMVYYNVDKAQAENRIVAYIAPDPLMIKAFEEGIDLHSQTAGLVFAKAIKDISRDKGSTTIGRGKYSERDVGKNSNHSLNYDISPMGYSLRYEVSLQDAKFINNRYLGMYEGVPRMQQWIQDQLKHNRKLTNLHGRTRLFLDRMGDALYREAYAFTPQSSVASEINEYGVIPLYYDDCYKSTVLVDQIHDSVAFMLPLSMSWREHAQTLIRLKKKMEPVNNWKGTEFVLPVDCEMSVTNFKDTEEIDWKSENIELITQALEKAYNNQTREVYYG